MPPGPTPTRATPAEGADRRERLEDVSEERSGGLVTRRRRPSDETRPFPYRLSRSAKLWLAAFLVVAVLWGVLYAFDVADPTVERVDDAIVRWVVGLRTGPTTALAKAVAALGSVWLLLVLRFVAIAVLATFRRWRHLFVLLGSVLALRITAAGLAQVFGRPRPLGVRILGDWAGYSHPSRPVAALTVVLVGMGFALVPRGTWRTWWFRAAAAAIVALSLARVYLAVDHPSDALFAVVLGVAFALVPFRAICPDSVFPVSYRRGDPAHLEIGPELDRAIREELRSALGVEVLSIEPFGEEGSAGSTPLRIAVSGHGHEDDLFAKLYSSTHLRSDRWYKLGRTILYGSLEDEVAFNSVRQLAEYEDYMLRVMRDMGIRVPAPKAFLEVEPGRDYLLATEFLRRADEADEAPVDDAVIDDGLRLVARMWKHGLAHRDIKPANVLVRDRHVYLIDVAFGQVQPSPWRQAVDLANMMLVLALPTDAERVYARAVRIFEPEEIGEAFAATRGPAIPSRLRTALAEDGRDLVGRFRALAPRKDPIAVQRWSVRRIVLTVRTAILVAGTAALLAVNLANPRAP